MSKLHKIGKKREREREMNDFGIGVHHKFVFLIEEWRERERERERKLAPTHLPFSLFKAFFPKRKIAYLVHHLPLQPHTLSTYKIIGLVWLVIADCLIIELN